MNCAIWTRDRDLGESIQTQLHKCSHTFDVDSVYEWTDSATAGGLSRQVDVIFTQLDMSDEALPQLLGSLSDNCPFVVFVVPNEHISVRKINACALDYLHLPITMRECRELEARLQELRHMREESPSFSKSYCSAIHHLAANWRKQKLREVVLPNVKGYTVLPPQHVVRLECDGPYTHAFLHNGDSMLTCKPIKHYDEVLDGYGFVRIQHTQIINLHHIKSWQSENGVELTLNDGTVLPISMRRVPLFLDAFQQWSKSNGAAR